MLLNGKEKKVFFITQGALFDRLISFLLCMSTKCCDKPLADHSLLFTSLEGDDRLAELFYHVNSTPFYSHHCIFVQII